MRKIQIIGFIFMLFRFGSSAQEDTSAVHLFGGDQMEIGERIIVCADSGFAIIGTTGSNELENTDVYVLKLDQNQNCIWNAVLGDLSADWGLGIVEDAEGNFVVSGYSRSLSSSSYDVLVMKINQTGDLIWKHTYGGIDWDFGAKVTLHPEGGYLVCGSTYSFGNGSRDAYLLHVDSDGNVISQWTYGNLGEDAFNDVDVADGRIYLVGYEEIGDNLTRARVITCLGFDGIIIWQRELSDAGVSSSFSSAVCFGEYIYPCGNYIDEEDHQLALFGAYRLIDGSQFYQNVEEHNGDFVANDISVNPEQILISGYTNAYGDGNDNGLVMVRDIYGGYAGSITIGSQRLEFKSHVVSQGKFIAAGQAKHTLLNQSFQIGVYVYPDLSFSPTSVTEWMEEDCFTVDIKEIDLSSKQIASISLYDIMGRFLGNYPYTDKNSMYSNLTDRTILFVYKDRDNQVVHTELVYSK